MKNSKKKHQHRYYLLRIGIHKISIFYKNAIILSDTLSSENVIWIIISSMRNMFTCTSQLLIGKYIIIFFDCIVDLLKELNVHIPQFWKLWGWKPDPNTVTVYHRSLCVRIIPRHVTFWHVHSSEFFHHLYYSTLISLIFVLFFVCNQFCRSRCVFSVGLLLQFIS